ncbi:MAG: glutamine cyclotransferase [Cellvibrionaceae bacterium]|jgi:glutamine cyclotransferase
MIQFRRSKRGTNLKKFSHPTHCVSANNIAIYANRTIGQLFSGDGLIICTLFLLSVLFAAGCSSGQSPVPEEVPILGSESAAVDSTAPAPISELVPSAYPSPEIEEPDLIGYPQPAEVNQTLSYPEPESDVVIQNAGAKPLQIKIINSYPHSRQVFTQGLVWDKGFLYESGGLRGESALYRVNLADGQAVQQVAIDTEFFAEGVALVDDKIIMLTWQSETAIVFDRETFVETGRFHYSGQGWGLCYDESNGKLWMSDGSEHIVSRHPDTFELMGEIMVALDGAPVTQINELECVDGMIYANLWKSDMILVINPASGNVEYRIDASVLLTAEERATLQAGSQVLNGIAYNPENGHFYLTGKQWPKLFEVEFVGK